MDTRSRSPSISIASYPTSPDPAPLAAEHAPVHRPPAPRAPSPAPPALLFDDILKKIITVL